MSRPRPAPADFPPRDRSRLSLAWYSFVRGLTLCYLSVAGGIRGTGRENIPPSGPVLLVSNHASFLDVFALAVLLHRPLNYVARSTLFVPILGPLMRSVGAFPIQREGMGTQGFKETLKRLRAGGIVALFPEGTRCPDGLLGPLKDGVGTLCTRSRAPILPVGLAGTFEAWPRHHRFPRPHAVRIHYGPVILPEALDGLDSASATALIRTRMQDSIDFARRALDHDLGRPVAAPAPPAAPAGIDLPNPNG